MYLVDSSLDLVIVLNAIHAEYCHQEVLATTEGFYRSDNTIWDDLALSATLAMSTNVQGFI